MSSVSSFDAQTACLSASRPLAHDRSVALEPSLSLFAALYAPSVSLAALLEVARAFSPRFESYGSVVIIDASGLSRLFGSPLELGTHLHAALATHVNNELSRARVAIASTQVTAALVALGRPGLTVVTPGDEARTLAPFSLSVASMLEGYRRHPDEARTTNQEARKSAANGFAEGGWDHPRHTHQASRIRQTATGSRQTEKPKAESRQLIAEKAEARLLDVLAKWGIRTLGELAALPGPDVYERLGGLGVAWQRLARGADSRPLVPWVDEVSFEATLELEWPVDELEPLSFVLARLLEPLSLRLELADRGVAVLHTSLRLTTKAVVTRTLQLPTPMRDPKTLRTLILLDLESHPPDAAVDTVRVFIEPTPGRVVQWTLLDRAQPAPEQVSTLVARLIALMGSGHVGSPQLLDSWRPGAFEMKEFTALAPETVSVTVDAEPRTLSSALRRFRLPIPARVQMADGRPVRVISDRHGLSSGAIVNAAGPWRTSGEWWGAGIGRAEQGVHEEERRPKTERNPQQIDRMGQVGRVGESGQLRRQVGDDWSSSSHSSSHSPHRSHPPSLAQSAELRRTSPPSTTQNPEQALRDLRDLRVDLRDLRDLRVDLRDLHGWDRDEWDVAMHDGTIYRLSVERSAGQWFLEGIID